MGGPCLLVRGSSSETAPPVTDNFQVAPFTFDGETQHEEMQRQKKRQCQPAQPMYNKGQIADRKP